MNDLERIKLWNSRVHQSPERYEAEWRTIGGGAPALIDFETGSILAGCPGLEDEDVDDITGESDESRERRDRKQEQAESDGWESKSTSEAREAWDDASGEAPEGSIVLVRIGDDYHTFGDHAKTLKSLVDCGDGESAEFDHSKLDGYVSKIVRGGHRVAIAERVDEETGESEVVDVVDEPEETEPEDTFDFGANATDELGEFDATDENDANGQEPEQTPEQDQVEETYTPQKFKITPKQRELIRQYVGDDADDQQGFRRLIEDTWKRQADEATTYNDAVRNVLSNFGYDSQKISALISQIAKTANRGGDYESLTGKAKRKFDQMAEYAKDHYPWILGGQSGESEGIGDTEYEFFEVLRNGFKPIPAQFSEEVLSEAWDQVSQYFDEHGNRIQQPELPETEYEEFSQRSRGWIPWADVIRFAARNRMEASVYRY